MMKLDIKVGFRCNNMCRFCVQGKKRSAGVEKTAEEISGILRDNAARFAGVVFTGGEPTLRPELPDWVSLARELGYRDIQIQSNGRAFANRALCRTLMQAGASDFALAVHGHKPALHDFLTRASGSFDQTARGVFNLKNMGAVVRTNTVITRANYRNLPDIARLLTSLGVVQFQFAFVHALGAAGESFVSIVPRKTLVAPYVMQGLTVGLSHGVEAKTEAIPYCFLRGFEPCVSEPGIPDTKIYDAADVVIEDYTVVRRTRGKTHGPPCRNCAARKLCEGPWKEYPARYGWDEFIPIEKARAALGTSRAKKALGSHRP